MLTLPIVLSFGASDALGAAGVAADQLAIASMGCHAAIVLTAVSTQGLRAESDWLALDAEWVEAQAGAVLQNLPVAAFKVGAVASAEQVQPIAELLASCDAVPVVLEPLIERGADDWDDEELLAAQRELLIPQASVIVLRLGQARRLIALTDDNERAEALDAAGCAQQLTRWGAEFALITDAEPDAADFVNALFDDTGLVRRDRLPRAALPAQRLHGAGDTLSAALAGLLAQGLDVAGAAEEASRYTASCLAQAFNAGIGIAIPERLYWTGTGEGRARAH